MTRFAIALACAVLAGSPAAFAMKTAKAVPTVNAEGQPAMGLPANFDTSTCVAIRASGGVYTCYEKGDAIPPPKAP